MADRSCADRGAAASKPCRYTDLIRHGLGALCAKWMEITGETETVTSKRFANDPSFFARLHDNRPSAKTADAIVQRFSDHWPARAAWPVSIPQRPPQGKWDDLQNKVPAPGGKPRPDAET